MTVPIKHIAFLFFLVLGGNLIAQSDSSKLFTAPLNVPMYLAGNFGEIRPGHFHAGIDIKTQQVEGLPVLAAADGYVSRIKISLGGYGNALYITHPNGYTTAYGHLQKYNDAINALVRDEQYKKERFTVEMFFTPDQLPVKQGDTVALSGNSGGSGGPHLHFEIRKTSNSVPQNPLKFGFDIKDNITPIFKNLAMYPMNDTSLVNGKAEPVFIPLKKSGKQYVMTKPQKLTARGVVGFGVEAIDKLNGSNNRCGVYNITLKADSSTIYEHQMDAIGFDVTRFINTHVDFYQTKKYKRRIQKSYLTSYNKLKIYKNVQNKGLVYFSKYGHDLNYTITDAYGNQSTFDFTVNVDTVSRTPVPDTIALPLFKYNEANTFSTEDIEIRFPEYSFYEDMYFKHFVTDTVKHAVAPTHHIQNLYSPLQKYMTVSIRVPDVSPEKGKKFIAVSLNSKSQLISPEGGKFTNGWVTFRTRSLGPYTVMVDTTPPVIRPINFKTSEPGIPNLTKLKFKVADNLSGVKHYNSYIDGKWQLAEFDSKTGTIWVNLTHRARTKLKHKLELKIGDSVNNFKTFSFDFIW